MHLAETSIQAKAGVAVYGESLTRHLHKLGFLTDRTTLAHCIWVDDDDIRYLANGGCRVAHNPGSNLRLGSGVAPIRAMMNRQVAVGIGTDGLNSSDNGNMFEATRLASFVSRITTPDVDEWISSSEAFALATEGSAAALNATAASGRLAKGEPADIVLLDEASINYIPLNNLQNQLVNCEDGSAVRSVLVDGRPILWEGAFRDIDMNTLAADAREAVRALSENSEGRRRFVDALAPYIHAQCCGLSQIRDSPRRTLWE
jgi:5-methylthioadenosine/S-adenosylhomocysteine deaminase